MPRSPLFPVLLASTALTAAAQGEPAGVSQERSREVRLGEPQLFVDDHLIENRFNENFLSASVPHVFHVPRRTEEPLITRDTDKPWEADGLGYLSVVYDSTARLFRLYYQVVVRDKDKGKPGYPNVRYAVGYAESEDGLRWSKPLYDLVPWGATKQTNILLTGRNEAHAPHIQVAPPRVPGPIRNIGTLPRAAFRGRGRDRR